MNTFISLIVAFLYQTQLSGWDLLSTVEIVKGYDEFVSAEIDKPVFSSELKNQDGKPISLEGFMIPMQEDTNESYFILSRLPYQSCFFCGGAGPETVVEVYTDRQITFTDERIRVEGILKLNDEDPLQLFYILKKSEVTKL